MDNITFYNDKSKRLNCLIEVKGVSIKKTSARLVLEFGDVSYMYNAAVSSEGKCSVLVPPLPDVPRKEGHVVLEVLAGTHLLRPMKLGFTVKQGVQAEASMVADMDEEETIPTATIIFETPKEFPTIPEPPPKAPEKAAEPEPKPEPRPVRFKRVERPKAPEEAKLYKPFTFDDKVIDDITAGEVSADEAISKVVDES
jgi:hypothetical protein